MQRLTVTHSDSQSICRLTCTSLLPEESRLYRFDDSPKSPLFRPAIPTRSFTVLMRLSSTTDKLNVKTGLINNTNYDIPIKL